MSLRPAKKSDLAKSWTRSSRRATFKMQLGHHLIVTEGIKTEPNYFNGLKKAIDKTNRKDKLCIKVKGQGSNTTELVDCAKLLARRSGIAFQHIWLVYDKDDFPDDKFNQVVNLCEEATTSETDFHAIWSNQCVELWYLLHFAFYQTDIHRTDYLKKLTRHLKKLGVGDYTKNRDDMFDVLLPHLTTAIANAERLDTQNEGKTPATSSPGTKMHVMLKYFKPYLK